MLRPPVTPRKRTPTVPDQPEIPAPWLEALKNSGTTAAPANAGTVGMKMPYATVRQADDAFTSRAQARQNYNTYYDKRVPVKTIDPYVGRDVYADSVGQMIKFAGDNLIKEPLKSVGRTLSLQNANTALNPFSGASTTQRLGALGEDTLNIAGMVPAVRGAATGGKQLISSGRTAQNQLAAKMGERFTPTASLENYILHGGVTPDRLAGGMLDPDYVRGGDKFLGKGEPGMMPVNTGPNQYERDYILEKAQAAENALNGIPYGGGRNSRFQLADDPRKVGLTTQEELVAFNAKRRQETQEWVDENSEIVRRIKAGEEHQTGVGRLEPTSTYASSGGNYVLDIPPNLRTTDSGAPAGEIKFWGSHKPVGFVNRDNPQELINKSTLQIMLDDADIKAGQTQKLANMIARARGTKVTPAYKTFAEETFNKFLNKSYRPFYENPDYNGQGLQYLEDFGKEAVPYVQNYNEAIFGIKNAKTEKEIFDIIDNLVPGNDVDIALRQAFQKTEGGFSQLKRQVISFMSGINPEYSRLKNVPRNGPVVVDKAPYPQNLVNWDSLKTQDGRMLAFANRFMDRRTPAEVIEQVYDEDLWKLMFSDPEQGQSILNERLSQLRRNQ